MENMKRVLYDFSSFVVLGYVADADLRLKKSTYENYGFKVNHISDVLVDLNQDVSKFSVL
jgi:hypothetical protein